METVDAEPLDEWKQMYVNLINKSAQYSDFSLVPVTGGRDPLFGGVQGRFRRYVPICNGVLWVCSRCGARTSGDADKCVFLKEGG